MQSYNFNGKEIFFIIWKSHHSFCDGISIMSLSLAMSQEYDRSYFVKSTDLTWLQVLMLRLAVPFQIPFILASVLGLGRDNNAVTKNKANMSGIVNCMSSNELHFPDVKLLSRKVGLTINDLVTSSISTSMREFFQKRGDDSKDVQIVIPANIRFRFYPSKEEVKLENKFSAMPLRVPLSDTMEAAYKKIPAVTRHLKSNAVMVYAQYVFTIIFNSIMPKELVRIGLDDVSSKFTIGFSNTPGPIKPQYFLGFKGEKIETRASQTYMVVSGQVGLAINLQSFCDSFRICVTSDSGLMSSDDNMELCQIIEKKLVDEMERTKDWPVPEAPKKKIESGSTTTTSGEDSPIKESKKQK